MQTFLEWLKRYLWAVFLIHQLGIFALAFGFLFLVRKITGRNIHLGRDPIGLIDGAALIVLSVTVIYLTNLLYRWLKGENASPLGIALSPRRVLDLVVGLLIGFIFVIAP